MARILALAKQFLGDHDKATRWLKHPNRALSGMVPVEALDTELGARQVENVLGRIAYGGISPHFSPVVGWRGAVNALLDGKRPHFRA